MITKTLDVQGLNCPLPILKSKKTLREIALGECLEVLATDPGSVPDFNAFCETTGHELVEQEETDGVFRFVIRRNK